MTVFDVSLNFTPSPLASGVDPSRVFVRTGETGAQGPTGPIGPQGSPGIFSGIAGQGSPGATGPAGPQGIQGPPGVDGATGPIGPMGATGATGANGSQGSPGINGSNGSQGSPGLNGSQGIQGSPGIQGLQGITGVTGPRGATGIQGSPGSPGITGVTGPIGANGSQGSPGAQGIAGPTGSIGPAGSNGSQGSPGVAGATGSQGATGPSGGGGVGTATINVYANPTLLGQFNSLNFGQGLTAVSTGGKAQIFQINSPKLIVWEPIETYTDLAVKLATTVNPATGLQEAIIMVTEPAGGSRTIPAGTYDWTCIQWLSNDPTGVAVNLADGFTFGSAGAFLTSNKIKWTTNVSTAANQITTSSTATIVFDLRNSILQNLSGGNIPQFVIGQFATTNFSFQNSTIDCSFGGTSGSIFRLTTNTIINVDFLNSVIIGQATQPVFAIETGAKVNWNHVGSFYQEGIGRIQTGTVGTFIHNVAAPTGMGVMADRVFYDDTKANVSPTFISVGSAPTVQNAIDAIKRLAMTGPAGPQGPQGIQGVTGPSAGPQGIQGSPGVAIGFNIMQVGQATGIVSTFGPSGIAVLWAREDLKQGFLSHTTVGTAASVMSIDAAGIYRFDYQINTTGVFSGANIQAIARINATGIGTQGSAIPQSVALTSHSPNTTRESLKGSFIASIQSGAKIELFIQSAQPTGIGMLWGTGSNFSAYQIG